MQAPLLSCSLLVSLANLCVLFLRWPLHAFLGQHHCLCALLSATKGFGATSGATEAEGSRVVPRQLLIDQQDLLEIISSSTHPHPAWWIRNKAYLRGGDKDTNISAVNFTFNKNVKIIHRVLGLFGLTGFKVIDLSFKHLQEPSVHMMKLLQRLKIQVLVSTF